jgi:hypothetical protein
MKPKLLRILPALLAMLTVCLSANATIWVGANLGSPGVSGTVVTNGDGSLTITGGGDDIWNSSDNCYYYFTWVTGNFDAKVRVQSLDTTPSAWAKTEMMVRCSDGTAGVQGSDAFLAAMCAAGQSPANQHQYRPARSAAANNNLAGAVNVALSFPNNWLRVTRTNSVITIYAGSDGVTWTALATVDTANATGTGFTTWPDLVTVGVAVTGHNNNTNTTTVIDAPSISSSGTTWTPPTAAGIKQDVANSSTYVGSEASFSLVATNNAVPVSFAMAYQWYRGGAVLQGVTRNHYTFLASTGDIGAQVQCVAWPVGYPSITTTSSVGSVAVSTASQLWTNGLKMEIFANSGRRDVEIGNVGTGDTGNAAIAGKLHWLAAFDDPGGWGDYASRRVTGWFIPWTDGNYTFYVSGDDDTDLFLSSDATPNNKTIICQEPSWSGYNSWTNAGSSTNDTPQKCSDTWTNGAGVAPNPSGVALTAGNLYYIEAVLHNGTGGDGLGVYAKLFADAAPSNGTLSTLTAESNNIVLITYPLPPTLAFLPGLSPTNVIAAQGNDAFFFAGASGNSEFQPHYQWQKYGTNVPGANGTSFTMSAVQNADNGTPVRVIASVPGLSITSSVATMTIGTGLFEPGFTLNQRWNGVQNWGNARDGSLGVPTYVAANPAFEAAVDNPGSGNMLNYTRKLSGLFIAPATDRYVFFCNSDDGGGLFISTDANPANKYQIAQQNGWSGSWQWTEHPAIGTDASGNNIYEAGPHMKRSDEFTNSTGAPFATGIPLQAGQKYYVEYDAQQGGGGGNMEVTYKRIGDGDPALGSDTIMTGSTIGFNAPLCHWVQFTLQPTNPPAVGAGLTNSVNFYAQGTSDSTMGVGSVRSTTVNGVADELVGQTVFFQWYKNGVAIPGATTTHLTLTGLRGLDNNAQVMCKMRALGYGVAPSTQYWSNSTPAVLSVITDPTVPVLQFSGQYYNQVQIPAATFITLTFNIAMDPTTLTNPASYTVVGANVMAVFASADNRRVQLQLDSSPAFPTTVTFTGLRSWSGIALSTTSTSVSASAMPPGLTSVDIGVWNSTTGAKDPAFPSYMWSEGTGVYTVAAEGSDIWNNNDGFNFLYEQKTGNFDVVVRQINYGLSSPWAKFGLMVREVIDDHLVVANENEAGRSRNWSVVNDPGAVPLNGGTGTDTIECNYRYAGTNVGTAVWWPQGPNQLMAFAPAYPNAWLRVKRVDQTLTAYAGSDGNTWFKLAEQTVTQNVTNNPTPMPDSMYVGICTTGHGNDAEGTPMLNLVQYNYSTFANYNSSYTGVTPPPIPSVTVGPIGTNIVVSWTPTGGMLQSSTDLVTWNNVGLINPRTNAPTAAKTFYRVYSPYNP